MWVWTWAAAALFWLPTTGVGARQEHKKPRQLAARVESSNITTSNHEGLLGSFKVGAGRGACARKMCERSARHSFQAQSVSLPRWLCSPFPGSHCLRP